MTETRERPRPLNVGIISDGIALTTGFANVARRIAAECAGRGWDVWQIASLDTAPGCDSRPYHAVGVRPYFPYPPDVVGYRLAPDVLGRERPDALIIHCDPGAASGWLRLLDGHGYGDVPTVLYAPIEGAPILPDYADAFRRATAAYTLTAWSARALAAEHEVDVGYVYHGVDRAVFHPRNRDALRASLGWTGRFVVLYVARNAARKGIDRLLKAAAHARRQIPDLLVHVHAKPFDDHQLGGWDLNGLAHWCGVSDIVEFADVSNAAQGVGVLNLARLYAAADLYVSTSEVEGFGLPLAEALASGLPVLIPADGGNQEEVVGDALTGRIAVTDWGSNFNGAQMAHVDPEVVAAAIVQIHHALNVSLKDIIDTEQDTMQALRSHIETAVRRGLARAEVFDWDHMARTLADAVERVATAPAVVRLRRRRPTAYKQPDGAA